MVDKACVVAAVARAETACSQNWRPSFALDPLGASRNPLPRLTCLHGDGKPTRLNCFNALQLTKVCILFIIIVFAAFANWDRPLHLGVRCEKVRKDRCDQQRIRSSSDAHHQIAARSTHQQLAVR